jgi:hypothetical protein
MSLYNGWNYFTTCFCPAQRRKQFPFASKRPDTITWKKLVILKNVSLYCNCFSFCCSYSAPFRLLFCLQFPILHYSPSDISYKCKCETATPGWYGQDTDEASNYTFLPSWPTAHETWLSFWNVLYCPILFQNLLLSISRTDWPKGIKLHKCFQMPNETIRNFKKNQKLQVPFPHPPCEIWHGMTHSRPIQCVVKNCCISLMVIYTVWNRWHRYTLLSQYTVCDHWNTIQHVLYYGTVPLIMQIFRLQLILYTVLHKLQLLNTRDNIKDFWRWRFTMWPTCIMTLHSLVGEYQPDNNVK